MIDQAPRAIIVGITSDIGLATAKHWLKEGVSILGSYRTLPEVAVDLHLETDRLFPCDFRSEDSVNAFVSHVENINFGWTRLLICPGTMNPIGPFAETDFKDWEDGFRVNFLSTLHVMRRLLPMRQKSKESPLVIVFAGGGVNSAPKNFSSYTVAKIALVKMIEILAEELTDTRFVVLGPGWVETKIHQETLLASDKALEVAAETHRRLWVGDFVPMKRVVDCIDWVVRESGLVTSGRNFSVAHDKWGEGVLRERLLNSRDMYKLRRYGNDQ